MALENIINHFLQDPLLFAFDHDFKDINNHNSTNNNNSIIERTGSNGNNYWDYCSPPPVAAAHNSSPEYSPAVAPARRKRRRTKSSSKSKEEMENQRMTHIAVERNRRRQVNDYLAVLRSFLPPSYAQRGDQASIVGGTIDFVKELEQLLQFLEAQKQVKNSQISPNYTANNHHHPIFSKFFTFPQYSTLNPSTVTAVTSDTTTWPHKHSAVADVEVAMSETHANVKILSRKQPKQLVKMLKWFHAMALTILHLNVTTTIDHMVLYTFSLKVEDDCQLMSVNEIATAVHEMVAMIQVDQNT